MEIKAQLDKPYIEDERLNFIVEQNHKNGYIIEEQNDKLIAMGYTDEELEQQKQEQLMKEFFNTSLGYVKRKVTMATGDTRDFLFDIKPTLKIGVPIITYNLDGTQNRGVAVTEEFLTECDRQVYFDFYGVLPPSEKNSTINDDVNNTNEGGNENV